MKKQAVIRNLTGFEYVKGFDILVQKAKLHNQLNLLLQKSLPFNLKGLTLCLVEQESISFIAENSAVAFRAEKQKKTILSIVRELDGLSNVKYISIKVDKKKY